MYIHTGQSSKKPLVHLQLEGFPTDGPSDHDTHHFEGNAGVDTGIRKHENKITECA